MIDKIDINIIYSNGKALKLDIPRGLVIIVFVLLFVLPFGVGYLFKGQSIVNKTQSMSEKKVIIKPRQVINLTSQVKPIIPIAPAPLIPKKEVEPKAISPIKLDFPALKSGKFLFENFEARYQGTELQIKFMLGHKYKVSKRKHEGTIKFLQYDQSAKLINKVEETFSFRKQRLTNITIQDIPHTKLYVEVYEKNKMVQRSILPLEQ